MQIKLKFFKIRILTILGILIFGTMFIQSSGEKRMPFKLPAYVGIILVKDNEVLLVKRCNTDWMSGHWNFPGGLLEENETLLNAAIREAEEETGVIIQPSTMKLVHVIQIKKNEKNTQDILGFYFMTKTWKNTPINKEPNKHSEIGWYSLNKLTSNITEHALQAIDGMKKGNSYSLNM